ncbi:MAG TPA: iron-containing redox enzyme family protein [Acidimicrobiales bacterium]|nr:iron-containing redox enzyme family protein [Acidimicrobiales bacterium]
MPPAPLPSPRGELTGFLFERLRRAPHDLPTAGAVDAADEDDLHLALYCLYELHYRGFAGVDDGWEWEPSLLGLRRRLEGRFESELTASVGPVGVGPAGAVAELWSMAGGGSGPSLSKWVLDHADRDHIRELFKHRSAYQLKEADPHTWAIPRLDGEAKAVMTTIQSDEYGGGRAADMHAELFARTMEAAGLDPTPNAYLDEIPGFTLATTNLISLLGLHRRWRGALVGHLALFEMTSTGPMSRYSQALGRLGFPAGARRFFDVHVEADEVHQYLATDGMVAGLLRRDPELAPDVLFGARCLQAVEGRFTSEILRCWRRGRSSLLEARAGDRPAGRPAA